MIEIFSDILNELSEAEKQLLDKIQTKLFSSLENQKSEKNKKLENLVDPYIDLTQDHPDILKSKNITGSVNELVFTVKAEASQIGDTGQLLSIIEIVEKFYHIPIELNSNYKNHIEDFFHKFHSNLEETCRIIHSNKNNEK